MFKPVTDIGKVFAKDYQYLNDYFLSTKKGSTTQAQQEQLSNAISQFFNSIRTLPAQIETLEYSLTVLFEIDQTINGSYGSKVFLEGELSTIQKLIRDIIALWFRFELLAQLERRDSTFLNIAGIRSFYDSWIRIETDSNNNPKTEYDRIKENVAMLLSNKEQLNIQTRILLFSMLGNILVTLGFSKENAEYYLLKYKDEIKNRVFLINTEEVQSYVPYAEILLNLHVLQSNKVNFSTLGNLSYIDLHKAIRFWSSTDDFACELFKSWTLYWKNDYYTPLTPEEEAQILRNKLSLYNIYKNKELKMGIGYSLIEFMEHQKENSSLTSIYKPIPLFMFGNSGVGKSSYLTAFCYDAQMRVGATGFGANSITLGRELQSHYQNTIEDWHKGALQPTEGYQDYNFWEDLNVNSFKISDYGGHESQPDQWDPKLQELYKNSRGLMFFIDNLDFSDAVQLRRKAAMFETFLAYWIQSNPKIKHIPIAVILTKADLVFGNDIKYLKMGNVVPYETNFAAIENFIQPRIKVKSEDNAQFPYGRFRDCVLNNESNNIHPAMQDLVQTLLDNFTQFFSRALDLTYYIQIFVTSSASPTYLGSNIFPFGVREPISWMATSLEKTQVLETLEILDSEEAQLNKEISIIKEDVIKMYHLRDEIQAIENEIRELQESKNVFKVVVRDLKVNSLKSNKEIADEKINKLFKTYSKSADLSNITKVILSVEDIINEKKDIIMAITEKRRNFENRKAYLNI